MTLPQPIQNTINTLQQNGFEAFAVGGAVRDFLLNKEPTDWDIATSAQPKYIIDIFGEKNCIPTGIKHGTVTLVAKNQIIEITTYRVDGEYQDNRHPEQVIFSASILEDLNRRDFTVNAMAYNHHQGLIDPFGGQTDLAKKIIRTVGEPQKRFCEDGLRIIRGLRFAAVLNFEIESKTKKAIHDHKNLLSNIARERIQTELSKLVMADNPDNVFAEFCDIFESIFELDSDLCKSQWKHNAKLICRCPQNLCVRLAILLGGISKNTAPHQILKRLKFDNKTILTVKVISNYIDCEISPDPIAVKHMLSELGEDMFRLVLEAKRVKFLKDVQKIYNIEEITNQVVSSNECYLQKDLKIDGCDLIELGISGKEIGRILKFLLNEVIENRCENKKSSLLELAKKIK